MARCAQTNRVRKASVELARSQLMPCSWLASTISSATTVISVAKHSSASSALRRVGVAGASVTGACGWVLMPPPGSRCPASVALRAVASPSVRASSAARERRNPLWRCRFHSASGRGSAAGCRRPVRASESVPTSVPGRGRGGRRPRRGRCARSRSRGGRRCRGGRVLVGGGAHGGSSELCASSRSWPIASSRLPAGSPAVTWARSEGRRSCSRISWQPSESVAWP